MINIDLSKVSYLAAVGSIYDVFGALMLIQALLGIRPAQLFRLALTTWDGDHRTLRSLCEQKVDAKWGGVIITCGFIFQAAAASGVSVDGWATSALLTVLVAAYLAYVVWLRGRHTKYWYMRAINEGAGPDDVKAAMRSAY